MDRPRMAVLCHDMGTNGLSRAYALARACHPFADVSIWGPPGKRGVWAPLRKSDVPFQFVNLRPRPMLWRDVRAASKALARAADVVYPSKPLTASYGLGRRARSLHQVPLLLDIDDWELGFRLTEPAWSRYPRALAQLPNRHSYLPTARLDRLARRETSVTVANRFLQARFGGTLVPHGRDTDHLDPRKHDADEAKRTLGVDGKRVVLFLGTIRPHKGLDELVAAMDGIHGDDVVCVLAGGDPSDAFVRRLADSGRGRVHIVGPQPFQDVPKVIAAADVYVVPQRHEVATRGQTPAKVYEAMAMEKPVVATDVGDLAEILSGGCGLVVPAGDVGLLRRAIQSLLDDPVKARQMGRRGRAKAVEEYSFAAMARILRPLVSQAIDAALPVRGDDA